MNQNKDATNSDSQPQEQNQPPEKDWLQMLAELNEREMQEVFFQKPPDPPKKDGEIEN